MSFIKEWILNLILDSLKGVTAGKINKAELNKRLIDFMNRQFKDFEKSGLYEGDDYQSLFDSITESLGKEIQTYLFGQQEEREEAKAAILLKGIAYASAKEKCSVEKVKGLLNTVLDIAHGFMEEQAELMDSYNNFLKTKQDNLVIAEETVAGQKLLLRYIFIYKNEKNRILYLRASALLKNDEQ